MKIALKEKKLKSGMSSLYIECYKGSSVDETGRRIHLRDFYYLKLYQYPNPKTASEKKNNKENLDLAENILAIKKADFAQGKYGLKNNIKAKRPFLDYFKEKSDEKINSVKNYGTWTSAYIHLKNIVSPNFIFDEINDDFVKRIRYYFNVEARTKSKLPLSANSKYTYYNKFKACLRSAFDDGYLAINYANKVKGFEQAESQREYLTFNELQNLVNTPCKYPILKNAFIFHASPD